MLTYETHSPEETYETGRRMAADLPAGTVIALDGDLGAGKTVFTKGFAEGLGIEELVTSPTFTILQEYGGGRLPLYHFDTYRIEDPDEMIETGLTEYLYGSGICIIEWADNIGELLPENCIRIRIERDAGFGDSFRRITVKGGA